MSEEEHITSAFNNISLEDLQRMQRILIALCDPLMDYDQAAAECGKSKEALCVKIHRSRIQPTRSRKMIRWSDVQRIKNKEV
ncbi:hypothetical protein [Alistipes sp.]|jgi:hypothetical protein|uniref:hypothetical protein n=1 Tax=Alistipes sp. TaxID=1872444 RepID=UPI0020525B57|nr:MAG TPA: hypothetical protein [Caudoviricetes sp.]